MRPPPQGVGTVTLARELLPIETRLSFVCNARPGLSLALSLEPGEAVMRVVFLSLGSPEEAIARVATRVRQGGHDVAPDVIRRRFETGLRNFLVVYRYRVDFWQWYDNSGTAPRLLEEGPNE